MARKFTFIAVVIAVAILAALVAACSGDDSTAKTTAVPATIGSAATASSPAASTPEYAYLFAKAKVDVVDLKTAKVVKEITKGLETAEAWQDGVVSSDGKYMFMNENAKAQVFVFDLTKQELAKTIDVGSKPVHIYLPNHGDEVWTHSDGEGTFYVISTKSLEVIGKVNASTNTIGHGKLLYGETLGTKYYATNVTEPSIFAIDGKAKAVTKHVEVCKDADGKGGTHGKGYSSTSKMAYFQCTGTINQTAVVDTATDSFVKYLDTNGQLFMTPGDKYAVVANSGANRLDVIDGSTKPETIIPIAIPNKPDKIYYATVDNKLFAFTADLKAPDVDAVDMQTFKLAKSIPGAAMPPLAADQLLGRNSDIGGGYFMTVVKEQNTLNIIDVKTLTMTGSVQMPGAIQVVFAAAHT